MIPQIIYLALLSAGVAYRIARHGETEEREYNGWTALIAAILSVSLLYWGGFFDPLFN